MTCSRHIRGSDGKIYLLLAFGATLFPFLAHYLWHPVQVEGGNILSRIRARTVSWNRNVNRSERIKSRIKDLNSSVLNSSALQIGALSSSELMLLDIEQGILTTSVVDSSLFRLEDIEPNTSRTSINMSVLNLTDIHQLERASMQPSTLNPCNLTEIKRSTIGLNESICWNHFDYGMLRLWDETKQDYCQSSDLASTTADSNDFPRQYPLHTHPAGWLRCRVHVDEHLTVPSSPHTMCDGANLLLKVSSLSPTQCLRSRPGYQCDGGQIWYNFAPGALSARCTPQPSLSPDKFPKDHLRDLFASFRETNISDMAAAALNVTVLAPVTVLVTRERGEHANAFHATSDFLNIYFTLVATGVLRQGVGGDGDGACGGDGRAGVERVQVLLLDEQIGPFETYIKDVFSPNYPLLRISALRAAGGGGLIGFPRALFAPPGYGNILLSCNETWTYCRSAGGSRLVRAFRRFVLHGLGVLLPDNAAATAAALAPSRDGLAGGSLRGEDSGGRNESGDGDVPTRVTLVVRRPYTCHDVPHTFMQRQFQNATALAAALAAEPGVNVTTHDLACRPPRAQAELMGRTDVLVAMHGAGLTNTIYMPPGAVVVEIWPTDKSYKLWPCFAHVARLVGLGYHRWVNVDTAAVRSDGNGDYLTVNMTLFLPIYRRALAEFRRGRRAAGAAEAHVEGTAVTLHDLVLANISASPLPSPTAWSQ